MIIRLFSSFGERLKKLQVMRKRPRGKARGRGEEEKNRGSEQTWDERKRVLRGWGDFQPHLCPLYSPYRIPFSKSKP